MPGVVCLLGGSSRLQPAGGSSDSHGHGMPLLTNHQPTPPVLSKKRVAFTTPLTYAPRLARILQLHGSNPLWCPTIVVEPTPRTKASIQNYFLLQEKPLLGLEAFSAIAFTSRTGISAFYEALPHDGTPPFSETGHTVTISALGNDAELLNEAFISRLCRNPCRIRVLIPPIPTPDGLVASLGDGFGRRILCPSPLVVDLDEPPVIPDFLRALASKSWVPVKVPVYETRWAGPTCAAALLEEEVLDAIVFTSTGEVEGLLKSLREMGFSWGMLRERWPGMVVAAHGPVTASGAESFGVGVDVVSSKFGSFDGVVEALAMKLRGFLDEQK